VHNEVLQAPLHRHRSAALDGDKAVFVVHESQRLARASRRLNVVERFLLLAVSRRVSCLFAQATLALIQADFRLGALIRLMTQL
jgi:hypothetical protein